MRQLAPAIAFCLYDFGYSAFSTIVSTFVFATYFTTAIATDRTRGAAEWSLAMAVAGVLIAVASPIAGAIADQSGTRKSWLGVLAGVCIAATAALWWAKPVPKDTLFALSAVVCATVAFEMGLLFYNALLPVVAPPTMLGRLSGWAWGTGYAGGLIALVIALTAFVQAHPPPFGLDSSDAEPVRATALLVAAWLAVFATPLFVLVKEPARARVALRGAARAGLRQLAQSLRDLKGHGNILHFLLAAMLYTDGVHTVFALGGVYAASVYGMDVAQVITLGISLNVTAGLGAFIGGWADDRLGSKRTIVLSLCCLLISSTGVLLAPTRGSFWIAALVMSTFFGPVQAASRTLMARLAPPSERGQMFGLFALSGRVTAFAGPAAVGWVTLATGSQRWGLSTVLIFLAAGLVLIARVRDFHAQA